MGRFDKTFNDGSIDRSGGGGGDGSGNVGSDGNGSSASVDEFIAHIVDHGDVRHAEKDAAEDVVSDERVAAQSQRGGAVFASETAAVEETSFGAHPFHQVDALAAKMARLRAALLR